jgi:lipopolysaccharide biosynthesis regulator YciM
MKISTINSKDIPKVVELLTKLYLELGKEKESIDFLNEELILKLTGNNKTIILKAES